MQARALACALRGELPFLLYTSPVARALETAQTISTALDVPVEPLEGLAEADAGDLEGLTGPEMRERHPEFARRWDEDPGAARMPGGESLAEVQHRAWGAVERLLARNTGGTVVAVSHNFTIQTIVCRILGIPLRNFRRLRQEVGSITRLELTASSMAVLSLNETAHLPG